MNPEHGQWLEQPGVFESAELNRLKTEFGNQLQDPSNRELPSSVDIHEKNHRFAMARVHDGVRHVGPVAG